MPQNFQSWYEFQRDFLLDKSLLRHVTKFRQGGFTETIACEGVTEAARESFPSEWVIYVSAGQRQAKEIKKRCKWWIQADPPLGLGLSDKSLLVDNNEEIILPNQSGLAFLPSVEDTIRGYVARRVYLDEFAHNKKDKAVFQAISPSLTRQDTPRYLTLLSSAFGKRGKHYEIFHKQNNYSKHIITIDDAIKAGYPANVDFCRELAGDDLAYRQEYKCEYLDDAMSYFAFDLILACVNADLENATAETLGKEKGYYSAGYDPAKKVDSGVFVVLEKKSERKTIRHIKEFIRVSYQAQIDYIVKFMKAAKITRLLTDETGVGQKVQEDLNRILGNSAKGITYTNPVKEMMIVGLHNDFENGNMEIPDNTKLKNQLHNLEREIAKTGTTKYNAATGEHDDYVWALCNANNCFSSGSNPRVTIL